MKQQSNPQGFVAKSLAAHSLLGLVLGALIYQICLTGTLTVFAGELRQWEQPAAPVVQSLSPEAYATAVAEGAKLAGKAGPPVIILGPTRALPRLEVRIPGKEGGGYADAAGYVRVPVDTGWTDFVTELHERLHMPGVWGIALVATAGIALLAALITGIAAHPRIFRDAFRLRRGGNVQLEQADLHNRTGVWGLPFHLIVTISGCFLALVPVLGPPLAFIAYEGDIDRAVAEMSGEMPGVKAKSSALPDVASLIRRVESEHAPARVSFVMLEAPATTRQVLHIDTDVPRQLAAGESYRFDGDGKALGVAGFADGPLEKQLHSAMFQLHFGSFGGLPVQLLYGVLGSLLCWLISTGIRIWLIRQASRGRSVAVWTRLWDSIVWGQVTALAVSAVFSLATFDPLIPYVSVSLLALASSLFRLDPAMHRRLLLIACAAVLSALAAYWVALNGVLASPAAFAINLFALITAVVLGRVAAKTTATVSHLDIALD